MKRVLVTFCACANHSSLESGKFHRHNSLRQHSLRQHSLRQHSRRPVRQPAAGDSQANVPTSQKVIKDPAEYNAYMTALNATDAAAKGAAMEAFVAQYPNSIVKPEALQQAMGAYQQANNQQKVEAACPSDIDD